MEDVSPWTIINMVAPIKLSVDCNSEVMITSPIWLTDEYVLNDFKSLCHMQIELVIISPHWIG